MPTASLFSSTKRKHIRFQTKNQKYRRKSNSLKCPLENSTVVYFAQTNYSQLSQNGLPCRFYTVRICRVVSCDVVPCGVVPCGAAPRPAVRSVSSCLASCRVKENSHFTLQHFQQKRLTPEYLDEREIFFFSKQTGWKFI